MSHSENYFNKVKEIINHINLEKISEIASKLSEIRKKKWKNFFYWSRGSAGNCSHAVNDFRKLCEIECYSPSDNQSELTARINDEGWDTCYSEWLKNFKIKNK